MDALIRAIGRLPRPIIKFAARSQWRHPLLKRAFEKTANLMRHRDAVIQQGIGRGLRFNAGGTNAGYVLGTSEPGLQNAFALFLKEGMHVVDVGANVGFQAVLAARLVGKSGRVSAFDPAEENIRRIEHNARLNGFENITPFPLALSAEDGEASFLLSEDSNWGRLAEFGAPARAAGERRVRVRRLDALVAEGALPPPDVMKIDVEGAEGKVLVGARETLLKSRPLLFVDLHGTNAMVADTLESIDYDVHVLGGGGAPVRTSKWDVQVLAVPRERADLLSLVARATDPAIADAKL